MASDLLIIYDNAVDRATVTASSTSGTTAIVNNIKNDIKGKVHRANSTSTVTFDFTWSSNQTIGAIAIPMINVSAAATMAVTVYSADNWTSALQTINATSVFTYSDIANWNSYNSSATANEFGIGRYSSGYLILNQNYSNVRSARVVIAENTTGVLIDTARIVMGKAWRPIRYASNGVQLTLEDTASKVRTNSGNITIDPGFLYNNLSFEIRYMDETDRTELIKILKMVGSSKNVFVSIFPSSASRLRDDYSIYGTITRSPLTYVIYGYYTNTINIEGW